MDHRTACLLYLHRYQRSSGGITPTYRQIKAALGLPSTNTVQKLLLDMERRGQIRRMPNRHRAIEVLAVPLVHYHEGNAEFWRWDDEGKCFVRR